MAQYGYGYPPPPVQRRSAPGPVHVVAGLMYMFGGVLLLLAVVAVLSVVAEGLVAEADLPPALRDTAAGVGIAIGVLLAVVGFASLVLARKVQRGRQWARVLVLVLSGLSLAATVLEMVRGGSPNALSGLVLPVLFAILLSLPDARAWFRPPAPPPQHGSPYGGSPYGSGSGSVR